jgi:hypothetical protein
MAIGDTVQAGLMRVDTTPLLQAQIRSSEQMGNAIAGLGRDIGSGIEKFMQNKKEGEAADMQIGALLQNMSPERQKEIQSGEGELGKSLSKFLSGELGNSKKKALLGSLMTINTADQLNRKEAMDAERFKQQQEINNLNRKLIQGKIDDRLSDKQATDRFITMLNSQKPTGELNEAGQDDLERGLAFLAPGPQAREESKNRLLQDPQFQQTEPVMGMSGNRFMAQFANESPAVQEIALAFMQSRQKDAPKPMTPIQEAELQKIILANRKTELELSDLETPKETYKPGPDIMANNIKRANDIMDNDGIIPATSFGGLLKAVPGTDAHKLGNLLQTIKGNIGFDYLQKMRQDSPTGGALGQVSNQELSTLQSVFGSLEQTQKAEDLKYNLQLLNHVYNNIIHGVGNHNIDHPDVMNNSQNQTLINPSNIQSEIERKRQMLRARQMNAQYFDNPNVPNIGNINSGN